MGLALRHERAMRNTLLLQFVIGDSLLIIFKTYHNELVFFVLLPLVVAHHQFVACTFPLEKNMVGSTDA